MTVAASTPLVEMRNINIAFGGVHAVRDVSIDLHPGELIGLVGHNGAGKSTLMRALSGAHPADSGEILHQRQAGQHPQPARRQELQHRDDLPDARARRQHRCARQHVPRPRAHHAHGLARRLRDGVGDAQDHGPAEPQLHALLPGVRSLSGGQRQAIAIARAIYFNARVLIMDEPTAALGPSETAQVHNLVRQLKTDGIGIFLVSHDIHDVFDLSDRICVMYHGSVVDVVKPADVTPDEVLGMIILGKRPGEATAEELATVQLRQ